MKNKKGVNTLRIRNREGKLFVELFHFCFATKSYDTSSYISIELDIIKELVERQNTRVCNETKVVTVAEFSWGNESVTVARLKRSHKSTLNERREGEL